MKPLLPSPGSVLCGLLVVLLFPAWLGAQAPELVVLGTAQDAGHPQIGCHKACCEAVRSGNAEGHLVSCLGLISPASTSYYLLDATPDFSAQHDQLAAMAGEGARLGGIFLTHAHIGHYTGLMYLGREAMGAREVPVWCMPRMAEFLAGNGPWSLLDSLRNVDLHPMAADQPVALAQLQLTPILVPHRDEFSETVGFLIQGPEKTALFIPDIDKWSKWDRELSEVLEQVDYAFLDATFFSAGELPGRNMAEIPHPMVVETMELLADLPATEREKVYFIHFNHSNPLLQEGSEAISRVEEAGFHVARRGMRFQL